MTTSNKVATAKAPRVTKAKANAPLPQSAPAAQAPVDPLAIARANVQAKLESGVGVTLHTNGKAIKGLSAEPLLIKPTRKHAQRIDTIKGHSGKGNCIKRFHLYKAGDTMLHCKVTEGLIWSDVTFYAECGYLTIREATDAEFAAMLAEWQAAQPSKTAEAQASAA